MEWAGDMKELSEKCGVDPGFVKIRCDEEVAYYVGYSFDKRNGNFSGETIAKGSVDGSFGGDVAVAKQTAQELAESMVALKWMDHNNEVGIDHTGGSVATFGKCRAYVLPMYGRINPDEWSWLVVPDDGSGLRLAGGKETDRQAAILQARHALFTQKS